MSIYPFVLEMKKLLRNLDGCLDKGHYFVLAPLGGIGARFRAGELVDLALRHVLNAVLMSSRCLLDRALGPNVYAKSALPEALPLDPCGNRRLPSANRTIPDS